MSPPTTVQMDADKPDLGANQEGQGGGLVRHFARHAQKLAEELDLPISGSRIRRIVRRYVREGRFDIDFRTWFISYADPTGETAVRNVMREREQ